MEKILEWCYSNGKAIWEFVSEYEEPDIWDYLAEVWKIMQTSIKSGLEKEGTLPGVLKLARKAPSYHVRIMHSKGYIKKRTSVYAYALAVSEENASGNLIGFDQVVKTMMKTGQDLPSLYKETSAGGLAMFHGIDRLKRE